MPTPSDDLDLPMGDKQNHKPDSEGSLFSRLPCVLANDPAAAEELGRFLLPGLRLIIRRRVNDQDVDDVLHDTLVDVLAAVHRGILHNPEALAGFARTIAVQKCAACIQGLVSDRASDTTEETLIAIASRHPSPERAAMDSQKIQLARAILSQLLARDREILRRFYLEEQSQDQICKAMQLSSTQFRLVKSRAKAKFGNLGRSLQRRTHKPLGSRANLDTFNRSGGGDQPH
jgi:RNA polymerase sigma-70 factor, ECF subfamily